MLTGRQINVNRRFAMTSKKQQPNDQENPSPKEVELQKRTFLKKLIELMRKQQRQKIEDDLPSSSER
jgi:hypothetical protein